MVLKTLLEIICFLLESIQFDSTNHSQHDDFHTSVKVLTFLFMRWLSVAGELSPMTVVDDLYTREATAEPAIPKFPTVADYAALPVYPSLPQQQPRGSVDSASTQALGDFSDSSNTNTLLQEHISSESHHVSPPSPPAVKHHRIFNPAFDATPFRPFHNTEAIDLSTRQKHSKSSVTVCYTYDAFFISDGRSKKKVIGARDITDWEWEN